MDGFSSLLSVVVASFRGINGVCVKEVDLWTIAIFLQHLCVCVCVFQEIFFIHRILHTSIVFWTNLRPKFFFSLSASLYSFCVRVVELPCACICTKMYLLKRLNVFCVCFAFACIFSKVMSDNQNKLVFSSLHYKWFFYFLNGLILKGGNEIC